MFECGCYLVECYGRLVWVEVLCWIDRVWSSKGFVCCVWGPSVHPSVPSIGFCMSESISSFKSLITGVCSPYSVSLCDFAYYGGHH